MGFVGRAGDVESLYEMLGDSTSWFAIWGQRQFRGPRRMGDIGADTMNVPCESIRAPYKEWPAAWIRTVGVGGEWEWDGKSKSNSGFGTQLE